LCNNVESFLFTEEKEILYKSELPAKKTICDPATERLQDASQDAQKHYSSMSETWAFLIGEFYKKL